MDAL
jgi:hypothetical protein